jgi:predicted AAA+ superfamily ATPase
VVDRLIPRYTQRLVVEALADTRVVFLGGARQVGKSTLASQVADEVGHATQVTLDDGPAREAATADPEGFVANLARPVFIDEVQRAPDLLLAIKRVVDADPAPGQFLLTGSANVVTAHTVKDALTGRMETIRLWPLAQNEIHGSSTNAVDALFDASPPVVSNASVGRAAFAEIVTAGGYPEARLRSGPRRANWFSSYLDTTLDRDLREVTAARKLDELPRLLRYLAAQAANVLSYRSVATKLDLDHKTVQEYVSLLETVYLVRRLPAWRPGIGARETRAPKAYLVDSGLLSHLLGADERRVSDDDQVTGKLFENFVVTEILKHADWATRQSRAYHYRQREDEIDLVLESRAGDIVAVEAKAGASPRRRDVRPMEKLRGRLGDRFKAGVVVCTIASTTPLGDRLWAVPVSGLWVPM